MKRFERSNGLDTALCESNTLPFLRNCRCDVKYVHQHRTDPDWPCGYSGQRVERSSRLESILRHLKRYQYILPHNKAPVCVSPQFPDCEALEEGNGHRISCLIEHKDNLTGSGCKQFLTKMASIVFGDYRLIYKFMDQCNADITKLQCGRLETEDDSVSNNNND